MTPGAVAGGTWQPLQLKFKSARLGIPRFQFWGFTVRAHVDMGRQSAGSAVPKS